MAVLADLRYSARSLTRTPGAALALVLTIALGIGSNASVHGFVRGLITRDLPLRGIDTVVSLFAQEAPLADGPATSLGAGPGAPDARSSARWGGGPMPYDDYRSLKDLRDTFEWIGAARESQGTIMRGDRTAVMSVAAVTSELADLFDLLLDDGVVISHRVWVTEFGAKADVRGEAIRIDGAETRVASVAPEWLDGLYLGRLVDIWMPLDEASVQGIDRRSRSVWVLGRLRTGVSIRQAEAAANATGSQAGRMSVLPYTGMTPDMAGGLSRIGTLLGAAAGAVFFIACANVASFLLARASARSHETSVRVALGASRGQLARQLLSDSVLISISGGALGMLLAVWTAQIVPSLFFDQDAGRLVFAPDRFSVVAASCICGAITVACGLMPMFEIRDDQPAAVLRRESAGPSIAMRRLRAGLVVAQMACCCLLVISTGLLLQGFRTALQTSIGQRLGQPILATVQSRPRSSRDETIQLGLKYFEDVEQAAQSVTGGAAGAWVGRLPGTLPAWQSVRVEPSNAPLRDETLDVVPFTAESLAFIATPPAAGRLFGGQDTASSCPVIVVNQEAADVLFDGDAVGRSIEDPAGRRVEIIGVVTTRKAERPADAALTERSESNGPNRPAVYYYPGQMDTPLGRAGPARFRVPSGPPLERAVLDANVVSASYFHAAELTPAAGRIFPDDPRSRGCRVGVINQEAAERYFDGNALGAAVIDNAGRRTEIIGVVRSAMLGTFQRRAEPAIYFPMAQDLLLRMTLMLRTRDATDTMLTALHRRLEAVPGRGPAPVVVKTLEAHLSRTALAPLRIATVLVATSAATALALGVLGLYGAMTDAARQRRREIAVRIALGAQGWRVIRQVLADGVRLAGAGTVAGMLGSLLVARLLARITPSAGSLTVWVWLAAPLMLVGAVAIASVLPARRALRVDPLTITREDT